jgi:hypothetical protein
MRNAIEAFWSGGGAESADIAVWHQGDNERNTTTALASCLIADSSADE